MFKWIKQKFSKQDLRNYEASFKVLEEFKQFKEIRSALFKRREDHLKKLFSLEGDRKLQMEGQIRELNWILNMDKNCLHHIKTFQAIANENDADIDAELDAYRAEQELNELP